MERLTSKVTNGQFEKRKAGRKTTDLFVLCCNVAARTGFFKLNHTTTFKNCFLERRSKGAAGKKAENLEIQMQIHPITNKVKQY